MGKAVDLAQRFEIFDRGNFSLMVIRGDIEDTHLPELLRTLEGLLDKNTHLLVNFLLSKNITESLFGVFITIKYLLGDNKKLLALIYLPESMKKKLPLELRKSLNFKLALSDSLETFKEKSYFPPLNLLKTIVGNTLNTLLFKYKLPLVRKKIFIKETLKNNEFKEKFMGDLTSGHILMNNNSFFHIGFSFSHKILENIQAVSKAGEIFDGIAFGKENIKNSLDKLAPLDFKLQENEEEKFFSKKLPDKNFEFNNEKFLLFYTGMTVVLPLSSFYGDIFLEIWIPKKFERKILESINS